MQPLPTTFIEGPSGPLECLVDTLAEKQHAVTAVICHPHPLFEGTMHNKVVTTVAQSMHALGIDSIRFNYRGVGASAGHYGEAVGELADCLAVVKWAQQQAPDHTILLAGFSFGGCIAMLAAHQINPCGLITVAPAVQAEYCPPVGAITCPWLLIQGDQDDVVAPQSVYDWVDARAENPTLVRLPEAGHFFHGQLTVLKKQLLENLATWGL